MRRTLLLLLAGALLTAGSELIAKPPPSPKPPPRQTPKGPKPADVEISREVISREIKGDKIIEIHLVTTRYHVWDGSKYVGKTKQHRESITKPLSTGGIGGLPPSVTALGGGVTARPDSFVGEVQFDPFVAAHLRIENLTGEKLRVFVQFRALNERNEWVWLPADPAESNRGLRYSYDVSESAILEDAAGKVRASRVRIWAESDSGKVWTTNKTDDFWLIPEDTSGQRRYYAAGMRTALYTFK